MKGGKVVKKGKEAERFRKIEELRGKYKKVLPPSDEFNEMKHKDWR